MTITIKYVWNVLEEALEMAKNDDKKEEITINCRGYDFFDKTFRELNDRILYKYMDESVTYLDRHKIAAIMIISILKTIDIKYKDLPASRVSWAKQIIAVNIGLNYMCGELNKILEENGWPHERIKKLDMPEAFSCNTGFEDIMIRNLVYAEDNPEWGLNPLMIAENLFLLEYITIVKKGIGSEYLSHKEDGTAVGASRIN